MIAYLISHLWLLWTAVVFVCLILELSSGDFYVTCFAIGAVGAAVSAAFGLPFWVQVLAWALCSVLSIWLIRPRLLGRLHANSHERPSNADALIGREGTVVEPVEAGGFGYVQVDGDVWKAVTAGPTIGKGEKVRIVSRDSIVMTVVRV
ncbi:nodulation efficiency protein NfeD [Segatella baroniae F0067]|uniref:Nodulation efficiency protein NfeD n=1 Tax=Segatella baroniae F0067 TaxID=1115809 RepID=U2P3I9_9BACT|nr:NfeD family protein [Segatella baroniae]ERK38751.1 nodulation efficiency protein NfeD [Segatella baroniae F0067]